MTDPTLHPDEEIIEGGPLIEDSPATAARALFLGILLLMAGNGLQGSLIGVRSETEGFSVTVAGFVMAAYFAGFLFGSRVAESLIANVGHIRVFAGLASMASTAVLIHALFIDPVTWGLMRFVTGLCMAGLYVTEESWLNDLATNKTRGRLLSMYMIVTMGGMTIGQFLLDVADPDGVKLFLLASVLVSASLIPVVLSASSNPPLAVPERMSLRELAGIVPTGIFTAFFNGATVGVLMGLGAVYAVAVDVPDSRLAFFLAAPLFGSMLLQWPIGFISDRVSRRGVILVVAIVAVATCVALAGAPEGSWTAVGLMTVLGAVSFPIYSLTIAFTADWLPTSKLTSGSAVLVRVNGVGALVGPLVATVVIGSTSPSAYFWCMGVGNLIIVVYLAWRIAVADAPEHRRTFVAFPARASASAVALMRGQRARIERGVLIADHPEFHNIDDGSDAIVRELAAGVMAHIYPGDQAMFSVVTVEPHAEGVLHDHPQEQWGLCLEGSGVRVQGDDEIPFARGDFWRTPGGVPHTMRAGADGCRILDVFAPPRDEYRVEGSGFGG